MTVAGSPLSDLLMAFRMVSLEYPSFLRHVTSYRHSSYSESLVPPENRAIRTGCLYDVVASVVSLKIDGENGSVLIGVLGIAHVSLPTSTSFDIHPSKSAGVSAFGLIFIADRVFINCSISSFDMKSSPVAPSSALFRSVDMTDRK